MQFKSGLFLCVTMLISLTMKNVSGVEVSEKLIGPKPSSERQYFNCSDSSLWTNVWLDGRQKVDVVLEKGLVIFNWKDAGWPATQLVKSSEKLPIRTGVRDEIRVVWEIQIEEAEYGAFVNPVIYLFDAEGKELNYIQLEEQNQPTGPGKARSVGITFKPDPQAKYLSLGLKFTGNNLKARLKSVYIEPAQSKPGRTWNVLERSKFRVPDIIYEVDNEVPKEDVAKLTPEEVDKLLSKREKAFPKIERRENRVQLIINNKNVIPAIYMAPVSSLQSAYFGDMAEIGFPIVTLYVTTGPKSHTPAAVGNIWLGKGKYDFEPIREGIRYILARAPDAYIMLNLYINVYNDWGVEHPGDVHTNSKGEKGISSGCRVSRYGGPPPGPNEFWEASNHSKQFMEDGSQMLKDLGKWLELVPEGKVVIGAYLNGSADGQWLFSNEQEFADYSEGTLKAFREYLKEKYKDNEALSKAWGFPVTFETATIPAFSVRTRQRGRSPLMSYNGKEAQASDYNDFLSVSNTRRQIAFARALKEGTNGRLLTGCYWPTLPCAFPLCHGNFWEMVNSPYIDFISRGGYLGAISHGKLIIEEDDLRNLKSGIEDWVNYDDPYVAKSQAEFRRQAILNFCGSFALGGGFHLYDMWGGWYWHPETRQIIKEALSVQQYIKDPPPLGDNYVGVFVDEDAANYMTQLGRYYQYSAVEVPFVMMGFRGYRVWSRTGLPVKVFLQQEALNPELVVPKVSIFINPFTMTPEQAEQIKKKFCKDGRVVVFMLAPGLAAPGDETNPEKITGFKIAEDERTINKPLIIDNPDVDPLLKGIRPGTLLCYWNEHMQWYSNVSAKPDSPGKVLAYYAGTDIPGMLVDRKKGWTEVWIGSPGAITPTLVRNLAREAGMTPILENDNELILGAGILAVHGITGGPQRIILPKNYIIEKCITGHKYEVKDGILTFTLGWGDYYGDTAIFSVRKE